MSSRSTACSAIASKFLIVTDNCRRRQFRKAWTSSGDDTPLDGVGGKYSLGKLSVTVVMACCLSLVSVGAGWLPAACPLKPTKRWARGSAPNLVCPKRCEKLRGNKRACERQTTSRTPLGRAQRVQVWCGGGSPLGKDTNPIQPGERSEAARQAPMAPLPRAFSSCASTRVTFGHRRATG